MSSIFKKLLRKEFGRERYAEYSRTVKEGLRSQKLSQTEIYEDIFHILQKKDKKTITKMSERLNESILQAFYINRNYGFAFVTYLVAFFALAFYAIPQVAIPLLLFTGVLFLGKTYEFAINKFCYIDVHITLIYKSVLEQLLEGNKDE